MQTWKRGLSLALALLLTAGLAACAKEPEPEGRPMAGISSQEKPNEEATAPETPPEPEEPEEPEGLTGQWRQVDADPDGMYYVANIDEDSIEVFRVKDGTPLCALFWSGTFTAPDTLEDTHTWESEANSERAESALLASSDMRKRFTYEDGKLSFPTTYLDTITTIQLEKDKWMPRPVTTADKIENISYFPTVAGGIEFSLPTYYSECGRASNATTSSAFWASTCEAEPVAEIVIRVAVLDISGEELNEFTEVVTKVGYCYRYDIENIIISGMEDITVAGYDVIKHTCIVPGGNLNREAWIFNPDTKELIWVLIELDDNFKKSECDYWGDFDRILETAVLADTTSSAPAPVTPAPASGIRPEFKEMLDSYEAFFDSYIEFMEKYETSDNSAAMMADYMDFMSQYFDTLEKMEALGDEEMSDEEAAYYTEVNLRISQKLLAAAQ